MSALLQRYDDYAIRHRAAFKAFKAIYSETNPPPVKVEQRTRWLSLPNLGWTRTLLIILTIASVIVSGAHTIPTVLKMFPSDLQGAALNLVGGATFVMVELGMLGYAFISARKRLDDNPDESTDTTDLLRDGKRLAFSVAVAANLYSVFTPVVSPGGLWDLIKIGVTLLIGVSAPALAYIAGEGFALVAASEDRRARELKVVEDQAMAAWNEALLTTWNSQKSRWGASVKVEKMENSTLSTGLSNVSNEAEITGKLPAGASVEITPKVQKVLDHLERFPDDLKLSDRKLAVAAGVSHPIVAEARKHL
jgi:hypothetical protein